VARDLITGVYTLSGQLLLILDTAKAVCVLAGAGAERAS
jgi:hypothetical protein